MNTFFLALFRPAKAFNEAKIAGKFSVMSFIVVLLLMLVNLILMIPATTKIATIAFSSMPIPENQIETLTQITHKMRYLQVIGSEILYLIMFLLYALLLYLIIYFAKEKLSYKNALQLIIYSYFIVIIGDFINTALLYARGLDAIQNIYETSFTGLNLLISMEQVGATFYTFLCYFTPFQWAFVILLSIGLKVFTGAKYVKALAISVLFWLITILIPTISVYFSVITATKSGIM